MELSDVEPFIGKWRLIESRNFEEYLRATGAPKLISDMLTKVKPQTEIKVDEGGTSVLFATSFKVKTIIQSARIDGTEHEIDIPIIKSFKKNKPVTRSKLTFDRNEGVMTVEVNRADGKERNIARRWIEKETEEESGETKKVKMTLELICEHFGDVTAIEDENEKSADNKTTSLIVKAVRVFEKK